jgi:hypothetical protein
METGDFLAAIVKEFATGMSSNMAIYCLGLKISMRGGNYHTEMVNADKKCTPVTTVREKDVVKFLILKKGALTTSYSFVLELRHGKVVFGKDTLYLSHNSKINDETLNSYLRVLESDISFESQEKKMNSSKNMHDCKKCVINRQSSVMNCRKF